MKKYGILLGLLSFNFSIFAQKEFSDVRSGNKEYKKENYTGAEVDYRRALDKNDKGFEAHFNLGNSLFKQQKYEEALQEYVAAEKLLDTNEKKDKSRKADIYHNIGNSLYATQQYDKAVAAYQESLRNNPKDDETRYNLVKAMQKLQEQQQQQQNQDQQNKDDKNQQQQKQSDQQKEQQQNQDQQQQDQQQQQEQQQNQQQQQEQKMDKETAEQILQALQQDEQDTQEKVQQRQGSPKRVEKDW